jgi:molybdopterin-binding protein
MAQILEGFINDTIGIGVISGRIVTSLIASAPIQALPPK